MKSVMLNFRVQKDQASQYVDLAEWRGMTLSTLLRRLLAIDLASAIEAGFEPKEIEIRDEPCFKGAYFCIDVHQ